jgi:hypothetical protein
MKEPSGVDKHGLFDEEGIPRTPKADDRQVERSPSALREVPSAQKGGKLNDQLPARASKRIFRLTAVRGMTRL